MDKRQQVLEVLQELPEEYLDTALNLLQTLQKQKRSKALDEEIDFISKRPKAQMIGHRNWKRADLYDRK